MIKFQLQNYRRRVWKWVELSENIYGLYFKKFFFTIWVRLNIFFFLFIYLKWFRAKSHLRCGLLFYQTKSSFCFQYLACLRTIKKNSGKRLLGLTKSIQVSVFTRKSFQVTTSWFLLDVRNLHWEGSFIKYCYYFQDGS